MHIWRNSMDKIARAYKHEVLLKPGVFDFLSALKRNGIRMILATATDRHLMEPALHRNRIYGFFEEIFTCREVGEGKETPLIYHRALEFLGLTKDEVWVFEDAHYAVKTAGEAGFRVAAIADRWVNIFGRAIPHDELMIYADLYIEDYRDFSNPSSMTPFL
jgi:HAD superfamily hydrolase (TIGR01509 family)